MGQVKRCDNLFLDNDLTVETAETTSPSKLTVTLGSAKDAFQYKVKWYSYNDISGATSAKYNYYNSSTGFINPFVKTGELSAVASGINSKIKFTTLSHNLINGNAIRFTSTSSLPGNISASTTYYVNDKSENTFYVETSVGGGNVAYSSTGSGTITWTGYPTSKAYFGETEYKNSSSGALTFGLESDNDTHYTDILVVMKIPGDTSAGD